MILKKVKHREDIGWIDFHYVIFAMRPVDFIV